MSHTFMLCPFSEELCDPTNRPTRRTSGQPHEKCAPTRIRADQNYALTRAEDFKQIRPHDLCICMHEDMGVCVSCSTPR